jgi:hypothetical protein
MTHAQLTENVRQLVVQAFARLGLPDFEQLRESILLHDGNYCGRRFDSAGAHAVWFAEENQIKVIASDGRVVQLSAYERPLPPLRQAA